MAQIKSEICKECGKEYNKDEVARIYGNWSGTYEEGFCSARCYTINHIGF